MLCHSVNPKIFLKALFIARLQSDISDAEYCFTEQAYVKIGTQFVKSRDSNVCSCAPVSTFNTALVALKKAERSGRALKAKLIPATRVPKDAS